MPLIRNYTLDFFSLADSFNSVMGAVEAAEEGQ